MRAPFGCSVHGLRVHRLYCISYRFVIPSSDDPLATVREYVECALLRWRANGSWSDSAQAGDCLLRSGSLANQVCCEDGRRSSFTDTTMDQYTSTCDMLLIDEVERGEQFGCCRRCLVVNRDVQGCHLTLAQDVRWQRRLGQGYDGSNALVG